MPGSELSLETRAPSSLPEAAVVATAPTTKRSVAEMTGAASFSVFVSAETTVSNGAVSRWLTPRSAR